jgi:hypothetical protein
MASPAQIEERVKEVVDRDRSKLVRALIIYYEYLVEHGETMPIQTACRRASANPAFIPDFIGYEQEAGRSIGIPDTRREARTYLRILQKSYPEFFD